MHLAMFGAVNTFDPHYKPYRDQTLPKVDASQEAAATAAAATVLIKMLPKKAADILQEREAYLARIPDGDAKDRGVKLGEEMALRAIQSRLDDGYGAPNAFRPVTQPGVYTETMLTVGWDISTMRPFALTSPLLKLRPLVARIGVQLQQERIHSEQRRHQQHAAITVRRVKPEGRL